MNFKRLRQCCPGFLIILIAGCSSSQATLTPLTPKPAVPDASQPTELTVSEIPETVATMANVLEETPSYGGPAVCPEGGGDPPTVGILNFKIDVFDQLETQFIDYLNQVGSVDGLAIRLTGLTLEDLSATTWYSTSNVFAADVTGDDVPEALIDIVFYVEGQYTDGAIYIFGCGDNEYVTIYMSRIDGRVLSDGPEAGIRAIEDFSGDGVPEIMLTSIEMMGTAANFHRGFRIIGWDGKSFSDLVLTTQGDFGTATVENGDGEIIDTDEDGLPELVLHSRVGGHSDTSVLKRPRTEIWGWDGFQITRRCSQADTTPIYLIQAIIDGDDAVLCGDFEAALAFYQQAIFDEALLPWASRVKPIQVTSEDPVELDRIERANLSAYGRYRILLLHTAQGFLPEAKVVYESLQEQFPEGSDGHAYAVMAAVFRDTFNENNNIGFACLAAIVYAEQHQSEILAPLGSDVYGFGVRDLQPYDVCPWRALMIES